MRGGIFYICKRFSEAKNKHIKNYDFTKESKYIVCLGANNLYDWKWVDIFLIENFKWSQSIDNFDVNVITKDSPYGYSLKVYLEYPDKLQDRHNDYPRAPEKLKIIHDLLLNYYKKITDKCDTKIGGVKTSVPKLVLNNWSKSSKSWNSSSLLDEKTHRF